MLRVHDLRFPGIHPKESRVKQISILQHAARSHIARVAPAKTDPLTRQFLFREKGYALDAPTQVRPKFPDIPRFWKTPGHAHDCDSVKIRAHCSTSCSRLARFA